jgi:hypothetical protein
MPLLFLLLGRNAGFQGFESAEKKGGTELRIGALFATREIARE